MPQRVWTNSWFGRVLCTAVGGLFIVLPSAVRPEDGSPRWSGWNAAIAVVLVVLGLATMVAVWTSRLVLIDGTLIARDFFVVRSMPLIDVVGVDPALLPFLGMKIKGPGRAGIRTFISGQSWDEWWIPRATRVAQEVVALADEVRGRHQQEWRSRSS